MKQVVVSRLQPQLVRKRAIVQVSPTVKVVVKNSKAVQPNQVKQIRIRSNSAKRQLQTPPSKRVPPSGAVVQKKNRGLRRATKVKYVTRGISPESVAKIKAIRGIGRRKILIIIGNGPSISEAPLDKLRNRQNIDTLSINKPDKRLWPTTHWSFFDGSQLRRHEDLWTNYSGNIFNSTAIKKQKQKSMQFKNLGGRGFSRDMSKGLHIGRSTVFASMQIALWMGYDHIYIFGCDMDPKGLNGKLHFYGVNPDVDPHNRAERFQKEAEHYDMAAQALSQDERDKLTFCSLDINPWPFMLQFKSLKHTEAVDVILEHANTL